ncbi:hypothetical protein [Chryseobacterium sp. MP_3.2]|nr:hypothetical protein [Chryseobacterium sp. MP_3.2]
MQNFKTKNGVSVRAYSGDAIVLLAFEVASSLATNLAGFSISFRLQ